MASRDESAPISRGLAETLQQIAKLYRSGLLAAQPAGKPTHLVERATVKYGLADQRIAADAIGPIKSFDGPRTALRFGDVVQAKNLTGRTIKRGVKVVLAYPVNGEWAVTALADAGDGGDGPTAGKCNCSKCTKNLTSKHNCSKCACIPLTLYWQPPPIWWLINGGNDPSEEWEEASAFQVLRYFADCIWRSKTFYGRSCDSPYGLRDRYWWELDLSGCKRKDSGNPDAACGGILRLVRQSGENCPEVYLEFCLTPKCEFQCGCPQTYRRSDFDGIDISKFEGQCDFCVTPEIDIPIPPCWDCPDDPPEAYELDVPSEAFYRWTDPESPYATSDAPNRLAGKTIKLKRIKACDNETSPGSWSLDKYDCPGTMAAAVDLPGFAYISHYAPCGGECNLYYFEDETTHVWLFVSAKPASGPQKSYVEISVTFVDKRSLERNNEAMGRGIMTAYYYLLEWEDELPWSGGQTSDNWCEEEEYEVRCGWFNTYRRYIADTVHWYATASDRDGEVGYTITQDDIDEGRLFGVEDDGSSTSWWKPTGTPGDVTWVYYTDPFYSKPYICNSNVTETKADADAVGTCVIRATTTNDVPSASGNLGSGKPCGGEGGGDGGGEDPGPCVEQCRYIAVEGEDGPAWPTEPDGDCPACPDGAIGCTPPSSPPTYVGESGQGFCLIP